MKNIHILPTDKPSRLWLTWEKKLGLHPTATNTLLDKQHIYITSDEEIKEICWCIDISNNELVLHQGVLPDHHYKNYKKIIITTDTSINVLCSCGKNCGAKESGIQAIDDKFLEWLCSQNGKVDFVEVIRIEDEKN